MLSGLSKKACDKQAGSSKKNLRSKESLPISGHELSWSSIESCNQKAARSPRWAAFSLAEKYGKMLVICLSLKLLNSQKILWQEVVSSKLLTADFIPRLLCLVPRSVRLRVF